MANQEPPEQFLRAGRSAGNRRLERREPTPCLHPPQMEMEKADYPPPGALVKCPRDGPCGVHTPRAHSVKPSCSHAFRERSFGPLEADRPAREEVPPAQRTQCPHRRERAALPQHGLVGGMPAGPAPAHPRPGTCSIIYGSPGLSRCFPKCGHLACREGKV